MSNGLTEIRQAKQELRERVRAERRAQADKDRLSERICRRLAGLPEYEQAATVLFFVGVRNEVRTQPFLIEACRSGKRVVVPYCVNGLLQLFHLREVEELAPGTFGVLEPRAELRNLPEREVDVAEVDLIVVPGLAFDLGGGRIGYGKGYYDRLLHQSRCDTRFVALAFQCQVIGEIPMTDHDVFMHRIVTEEAVYDCGVAS